jgi:hypothetical protein
MAAPELPEAGISPPRDGHEWRILGHRYWLCSWSESMEGGIEAAPGTFARLPRGIPHGYFNVGETASRMIFAVTPAGRLKELFDALHDLEDLDAVYARSRAHNVEFLLGGGSEISGSSGGRDA